jgi:hypothetical protein
MKKLVLILTFSLLLSACGDVTTTISNKNDNLFTVGNQSVTLGQIYNVMLLSDPSGVVRSMALQIILDKEVEITSEMEAKADDELASFVENVGDSLDMYLSYYGFKDVDDYRRNGILVGFQQEALVKKYIETNLDRLIAEYQPRKVRILEIIDPETAQVALSEIKAGADFLSVADTYGDGQFYGEETLVSSNSALPFLVSEYIKLQLTPTLSDVLPAGSTNYIVQLTVVDPYKMVEEVKETFARDNAFIEIAIEHFMKEYNFTIFDRTLYDLFINQFPNYLGK